MSSGDPRFWVSAFPPNREIDVSDRVTALEFNEEIGKADKLVLTVDNFDLQNFDDPVLKTGVRLEFSFGYPGSMSPIRRCVIQKVTGSIVLQVEALGMSVLMNKVQKIRTFEAKTIADVARQIAKENGYGEDEQWIDDKGVDGQPLPVEEQVTQARMTDAILLTQWARKVGFLFYVDFDGFHFHPRKLGQKPIRKFTYFNDPGVGDILSFTIENDVYAKKTGGVQVQGRDPLTKTKIDEKADNASVPNRTTLAPEVELFTGISARDGAALPDEVRQNASSTVAATSATTSAAAKQQAVAAFLGSQMAAVEMTMQARGDPRTVTKAIVEVVGIGRTFSGNYLVKAVKHSLGDGYKMTLKLRRDGKGGTGAGARVPAKGAQNNASAPPAGAPTGGDELTPVNERDGSVGYRDTAGRSQAEVPPADPTAFYRFDDDPTAFYRD